MQSAQVVEDVVESIFDYAFELDPAILTQCALVCQRFLFLSRKRFFRDVDLFIKPDIPEDRRTQLDLFTSNDYVASVIRHLRFFYSSDNRIVDHHTWRGTITKLNILLPKLVSLRHVSIHSSFLADWFCLSNTIARPIHQICHKKSIQVVELLYVGLSITELKSFLGVRKLVLVGVYLTNDVALDLDNTVALTDLSVTLRNSTSAESISLLLKAAAPSLKSLEWLKCPYFDFDDTRLSVIDLNTLSSLVSLKIWVPMSPEAVLAISSILVRPKKTMIENIVFMCGNYEDLYDTEPVALPAWHAIDSILSNRDIYPQLKTVTICDKEHKYHRQNLRIARSVSNTNNAPFQRLLPLLQRKGLVQYRRLLPHR